ncbi:unnamed protein product [Closterium sp. NIES-64]|nr:unnamed protein product [Closterium sp. NIES-64]
MSGESSETKETDCVAGPASSAGGASQVLSSSSAAATVATAATANNRRQAKGTAAAAASTTPERSPPSASVRGSPPDQQQLVTMFQALTPGAEAPRGELGGGAAGARPTTAAAAAQPGSAPAGKNISVPPRHPQPHSGRKNAGGADRSGAPGTKAAAAAGSTVGGVGSGSSGGSGLGGSSAADAIARRRPGEEGSALAEQRAPMEGLAEVPSEALAAAVIAAIVPTEGAVPKGNIASGTSGGARNSLGAWWSGDKWLYAPLAARSAAEGAIAVVIQYTLYPELLAEGQQEEAGAALSWVCDNIHGYGGDPTRVFLVAHGGHADVAPLQGRPVGGSRRSRQGSEGGRGEEARRGRDGGR